MKILWVENHRAFSQAVIREFLSDCEVTVCRTIVESVDYLRKSRVDVILLDYDLDDEKGVLLFPELAKINCNTPVIAVSSHAAGNAKLVEAGAIDNCPKMEFKEIRSKINSVLDLT